MITTLEAAAAPVPFGQPFQFASPDYGFSFSIYSQAAMPAPPPVAPPLPGITLRAAVDEVLASKAAAGLRPHSIHVLRSILNQFAKGRENAPLASIGVRDIENWLAGQKTSAWAKRSSVGRLSTLFSFHVRRDTIATNPCLKLERIPISDHISECRTGNDGNRCPR